MGLPTSSLTKLQGIQHATARTILGMRKINHITSALIDLHGLPIQQMILYKLLFYTWKAFHNQAPGYVCQMLVPLVHKRFLCSNDEMHIMVPRTNLKSYGNRAFIVVTPCTWNDLPSDIKSQDNRDKFKRMIKTHLFHCAFERI